MANRASEFALVGPETTCQLEPNSAATTHGTIAVYRPYSGGRPASVAKAKPCGSTSSAPSTPATSRRASVCAIDAAHPGAEQRVSELDHAADYRGAYGRFVAPGPATPLAQRPAPLAFAT